MPALFPRWSNTAIRLGLLALIAGLASIPTGLVIYMRTPFATGQFFPADQPVQFDHRHHVRDDGIDCRYCHSTVEKSAYASIPPTETCMNCHNQVWNDSPMLEPVRRSYFSGAPMPWNRVHDLPDFVYFNHAAHVNKGVGCVECHGRVDRMAAVYQAETLQMAWCLDCHRAPEARLRPKEFITQMDWVPPEDRLELGKRLAEEYNVRSLTNCTTCHR
jgi:hypothetical protein